MYAYVYVYSIRISQKHDNCVGGFLTQRKHIHLYIHIQIQDKIHIHIHKQIQIHIYIHIYRYRYKCRVQPNIRFFVDFDNCKCLEFKLYDEIDVHIEEIWQRSTQGQLLLRLTVSCADYVYINENSFISNNTTTMILKDFSINGFSCNW